MNEFHGPIDGYIVIPAPHNAGGTMNFNFGYPPTHGRSATRPGNIHANIPRR